MLELRVVQAQRAEETRDERVSVLPPASGAAALPGTPEKQPEKSRGASSSLHLLPSSAPILGWAKS